MWLHPKFWPYFSGEMIEMMMHQWILATPFLDKASNRYGAPFWGVVASQFPKITLYHIDPTRESTSRTGCFRDTFKISKMGHLRLSENEVQYHKFDAVSCCIMCFPNSNCHVGFSDPPFSEHLFADALLTSSCASCSIHP